MKITFVLASGSGLSGGDRVIAIYAQHLYKRGHDVLLVSPSPKPPSLMRQMRSLAKGKGWISTSRQPSHFDNITVPRCVLNHCNPISDQDVPDADVVIATWWETAYWVNKLSAAKGAKAYFVQHHEVFEYLPKQEAAATYLLPLHKIAVAHWLVEVMRTEYNDHDVSLVLNSVDAKQFYAPPRRKQFVPTFGLVYSPLAWKGCDISLRAFSLAAQKHPEMRLIAFGSSHPTPELPLPANAEFVFRPSQDQLKDLYAQCDAWLFGSRSEGFGLPLLEAMACRTPVIGTPVGAAPDLLADGAGILVKPEDPEDMARAIERVIQLSDLEWQHLSNNAYKKATDYTWDDATTLFETALQAAIERQQKGNPKDIFR